MPLTMAVFSFIGIAVTSATVALYGKPLWNPVELILKFPASVIVIAGLVVVLSSVTINVGANVMAPARAFENLWPQRINFDRRGDDGAAEPAHAAVVRAVGLQPLHLHLAGHVWSDVGAVRRHRDRRLLARASSAFGSRAALHAGRCLFVRQGRQRARGLRADGRLGRGGTRARHAPSFPVERRLALRDRRRARRLLAADESAARRIGRPRLSD